MMKTRALLLSVFLLAPGARASVTVSFSLGSTRATNWLDSNGLSTTQMVWGLVVDAGNNGFSPDPYAPGFSYAGGTTPVALETAAGPSDDLLILSGILMLVSSGTSDGAPSGMNSITTLPAIPYASLNLAGDAFRIIWFHQIAVSGTSLPGTAYGVFDIPGATMPNDGSTASFAAFFAGPDPAKPMTFALVPPVPEPSHALLGLYGLALLLPRRRTMSQAGDSKGVFNLI